MSIEGLSKAEAQATDQSIVDALKQSPEFVLAAVVQDGNAASHGYRVVQLMAENADDIANARRLGASIVPYQVFATSFQALNAGMFSSQALNFWHKLIYTYKVGFLLDPGVFLRNSIDSTLKNLTSTDGNVARVSRTNVRAIKMLHRYNQVLDDILKVNNDKFNYDNVHHYFKHYNKNVDFTEEQFAYIHGFIVYSASAGLTGPWKKIS